MWPTPSYFSDFTEAVPSQTSRKPTARDLLVGGHPAHRAAHLQALAELSNEPPRMCRTSFPKPLSSAISSGKGDDVHSHTLPSIS